MCTTHGAVAGCPPIRGLCAAWGVLNVIKQSAGRVGLTLCGLTDLTRVGGGALPTVR